MTAAEFIAAFAEKSKSYNIFEHDELIKAVKGCDEALKSTFFPKNETLPCPDSCSELAVKLVCYTITKITDYGFNKCINVISYPTVIGTLLCGNDALGKWVLTRFIDKMISPSDLTDDFKAEIFTIITTSHYVLGTILEIESGSREKAVLLFRFVKTYMPSRYKEFYSAFPSEKQNLIEALAQTPYFNSYASDDRLYLDIKDDVSTAIKRQTNIRDYTIRQESHGYFCAGEAYTVPAITETHHEYDVGEAVLKWLNSNIVCQYNLRSEYTLNNHIHNCESQRENTGTGCVTAQTLITMSDGMTKPIISLRSGMKVRSAGGISVLSDEFIVNRRLKTLYGINELEPFMSPEHAVMTTEGWKSLAPEQSNQINSYYNVTLLRRCDQVFTLEGTVRVEKITVAQAKPEENFTGYDLHFISGEKSYYANGLLVLLNYPDITLARLMRALEGMEAGRRRRFLTLFQTERDLFDELLPNGLTAYFEECAYEKFKDDFDELL